jgi:hypothetical protein
VLPPDPPALVKPCDAALPSCQPALGFYPALDLARQLPELKAKPLLLAAALRDPSIALREAKVLIEFGLLEEVVAAAPPEALAIASGSSPTAERIKEAIRSTPFGVLEKSPLDLPTRQRISLLIPASPLDAAIRIARDDRAFFATLTVDRYRESYARAFLQSVRHRQMNLSAWTAKEIYNVLVYGREELDSELFRQVFDPWLRTKLAGQLLETWPRVRHFVRDAVVHGRKKAMQVTWMSAAMRGITTVQDMLHAGEILDQAPAAVVAALLAQPEAATSPFYGLLASRFHNEPAFSRYIHEGPALPMASIFDETGTSIHRYFFYDDEDGHKSFEAFRATYRADKNWAWRTEGEYIRATGKGRKGRKIEIYANLPSKPPDAVPLPRDPDVLVHRGHAFHVTKTLRYLRPKTAFVFLGSCYGAESVQDVMQLARQAQVLATAGTGSHTVNDPLLKALNERMLATEAQLDWEPFWASVRSRFGGNALFGDYIAPHRNTAAILLRGYYGWLADREPR